MKKIEILAEKGFFKAFLKVFIDHEINKRVKMLIQIDKVTHEQNIIFTPEIGEKIQNDDFKTLMLLISETGN
jgi:hypothetical protein